MRLFERALQMYSVLIVLAAQQRLIAYDDLSNIIGYAQQGLGRPLEIIQTYCQQQNIPPLTSIVISIRTGDPMPGFDNVEDSVRAQRKTFVFDWIGQDLPSLEQLENIQNQRELPE